MMGAGTATLRIARRMLGDVVVLELQGRLDATLDHKFLRAVQAEQDGGSRKIVVDCTRLEYLGSRGVSAFIAVIDELREGGGDLKLARVGDAGALVLDRLGVSKLIQRFDSVGTAAEAFQTAVEDYFSGGALDVFVSAGEGEVFHASSCPQVARIRTVVTYPSKRHARVAGLRPCRRCCPADA